MMETGPDPKSPQDARLDALEARLERVQREETARTGKVAEPDASEHMGQRVLSYLLGGLFGGTLLGWLADGWFGTGHTLLITGMILGIVGAFWSIWKISSR
jgi:ATP synthase protein I